MKDLPKPPAYIGRIRREPDGRIMGEMREVCSGWPLIVQLIQDDQPGYEIRAWLGDVPEAMKIPGLDDEG